MASLCPAEFIGLSGNTVESPQDIAPICLLTVVEPALLRFVVLQIRLNCVRQITSRIDQPAKFGSGHQVHFVQDDCLCT